MLEYIRAHPHWTLAEGILFIILGILSMALPILFTFAVTIFLGCLLVFGGVVQIIRLLSTRSIRDWAAWLYALVITIAGLLIIFSPAIGALSITLVLIALFIISGFIKCALAFQVKPATNWGVLLFSGLLSLALAA